MSDFTDFFPTAGATSGGGGASGILKQHRITTSGTLDLTTLGIADGDTIGLLVVGSGSGGTDSTSEEEGGCGGGVWRGSVTIGTAGTVSATIPAGGATLGANGSAAILSGGGLPFTINTGYANINNSLRGSPTAGILFNGIGAYNHNGDDWAFSAGAGIDGYGCGGTTNAMTKVDSINNPGLQNTGRGGNGYQYSPAGFSGVIIIFYS